MSTASERLKKIASDEQSKWLEKAKWRVANEIWLDKSAKIALAILRTIRERHISQKNLADMLGISPQQINKILKGHENLTLETITKFETVLGISLSEIPTFRTTIKITPTKNYSPTNYISGINIVQAYSYKQLQEPVACSFNDEGSNKRKAA